MKAERLAVIGAGNMGRALIRGFVEAGTFRPEKVIATCPSEEKLALLEKTLGINTSTDNVRAVRESDVIVLSVKPQILGRVLKEISPSVTRDKFIISIAAGMATSYIESLLKEQVPVVRIMPNVSVTVKLGASAMCAGRYATKEHRDFARHLFASVGSVVEVDEELMDAVTGLSGTGPMYIFQVLEGLSDAGVKVGLSRDISNALAIQTVLGAAKMAQISGEHPGLLKDMVTSPGGTAIAALHLMEKSGLKAILIDAVEAATKRSRELGEKNMRS